MGRFGSSIARRIHKDRDRYLREGFVFSQWRFDAWVAEIESRHTYMGYWRFEPEPVVIAGCRILDEQGNPRFWPTTCKACAGGGSTEYDFSGPGPPKGVGEPCAVCDGTGRCRSDTPVRGRMVWRCGPGLAADGKEKGLTAVGGLE